VHTRPASVAIAIVLLFSLATVGNPSPTVAHEGLGHFFNSAIADSDGDGIHDLHICFEGGTPVHTNRSAISLGAQQWGYVSGVASGAHKVELISLGSSCAGANVQFLWGNIPGEPPNRCTANDALAGTEAPLTGYSLAKIHFNHRCSWDWGTTAPVAEGFYDAWSVAAHEMGHAYGINHSCGGGVCFIAIMLPTITDLCGQAFGVRYGGLSAHDAFDIRQRYGGVPDTAKNFPGDPGCVT
jgi:Matrixin